MKYGVEVLDSVELDEMTQKEIELVASELETEFQRNLQSMLREIVVKEMGEVKSTMQTFEGKLVELEERLLAAHQDRIAEVITRQQDDRKAAEDNLAEFEKRLLAEHRKQIAEVLAKQQNDRKVFEGKLTEVEDRLFTEQGKQIAEVLAKQQDDRKVVEDKLTEVEDRLIAEHRMQMDKVEEKLVRIQHVLLGLVVITLLAAITGIFL